MSETRKLKHSEITSAVVKPLKASRSQRAKKWARNLLGGVLLFTGCSTTNITNNYYPSPDGGAQVTDARAQEDANGQTDAGCTIDSCILVNKKVKILIDLPEGMDVGFTLTENFAITYYNLTIALLEVSAETGAPPLCQVYNKKARILIRSPGSQDLIWTVMEGDSETTNGATIKFIQISADTKAESQPCPDGGVQEDGGVQQDAGQSDACVPNNAPLFCSDTSKIVDGAFLNQGESAIISGKYSLVLADIEAHGDTVNALFYIMDTCGGIMAIDKLAEGETKTISIGSDLADITATEILAGYTFGMKAAKFSISNPCTRQNWCLSVGGILNQGEGLLINDLNFRVDDFMQDGGKWFALFSVLDANGNMLKKMKIEEGSCNEFGIGPSQYKVTVPIIGAGYTFGAKWADVDIYTPIQMACPDASYNNYCPSQ